MTKTRSTAHLHPDLSALMDKSAEDWSAPEIQDAARAALQLHAPDREPLTWIKRFGILPNDSRHGLRRASALEGPLPGRQFIQHEAKRELIGLRS